MKIFFNSSLAGKNEFVGNYKEIFDALEKTGHKLLQSPVFESQAEEVVKETAKQAGSYYDKLVQWIKQADVCVFEASYPSTSIGHEIALALHMSKPVIALHVKTAPRNKVLESIGDEKLQVLDYTPGNLGDQVAEAVDYALEQADTRFNFFISPQIGAYLDRVSKERRVPRAVYLRRLIEEDMESNEEYQNS